MKTNEQTVSADVAIIGSGFGAIAAAQALLERGLTVVMTEEFPWIGGQATSQALCVPDEYHDPVFESGGSTRRYFEFRDRIRDYYKSKYQLSKFGAAQLHFNPGGGTTSIAAEPHVAHEIIMNGFQDALNAGNLKIFTGVVPQSAERSGKAITSVTCAGNSGDAVTVRAKFFLSGDETGELYPLLNIGFRQGTESKAEFDEPHAPEKADSDSLQSYTYCFAMEYVPGGNFTIPPPPDYDRWKKIHGHEFLLGAPGARPGDPALMFRVKTGRGGIRIKPAFYYRSTVRAELFSGGDAPNSKTIFNVVGNDYCYENFVGKPPEEKRRILNDARGLSLAYMYWLQTEAPRDDGGGSGWPELRPLPESTGTPDGVAMGPYVREGRRLKACRTIIEQDISTACQKGARAKLFDDSVGVGCFLIDLHRRNGATGISQMARPYQIPLGALVTEELDNFAVAAKGIGVTQITNGAYRLHALEWNIGEAAGELAAYCLEKTPVHPYLKGSDLFDFQRRLLRAGFTLFWFEDLPLDHPGFEVVQLLAAKGIWPASPAHLRFNPNYSLARASALMNHVLEKISGAGIDISELKEYFETAASTRIYDAAHQIVCFLDRTGWPEKLISGGFDEHPAPELFNDWIPGPMDEKDKTAQLATIG
ncbi:MAG: FAD-dependent oxidoreductase [Kiritimatiellales bacterium]